MWGFDVHIFFVQCLFKSLVHFFQIVCFFKLLIYRSSFDILMPVCIRYMYYLYFLPACGLPFQFLTVFWWAEAFNADES